MSHHEEIAALESEVLGALRRGNDRRAGQLWEAVLQRAPAHPNALQDARLVAHLPLIVPPGCGFRVGNDTREWVPGKAWVFDDTIEHEAWNDSAQLRVVLIFDIWHPHLSQAERALITAMSEGINAFSQSEGGFGL